MSGEQPIEVATEEQLRTLVAAEEVLGETLVVRTLKVTWTRENEGVWCWFNGCNLCDKELIEGEEGYIWGRPLGNKAESEYATLQSFCSTECVEEGVKEWAEPFDRDLMIAWHADA